MPAKPFSISLEVEEIALGTVLRKLHEMPGIVKMDFNLGHGGNGPGRSQLAAAAASSGGSLEEQIIKVLMTGNKTTSEIVAETGAKRASVYSTMHTLKKKKVIKRFGPKGFTLTAAITSKLSAGSKPAKAAKAVKLKKTASGRAAPGSGQIILVDFLNDGPKPAGEIYKHFNSKGMSPKSASGVLARAKRDSLVKKNGEGYALTAKGTKIEAVEQANG